MISHYVIIPLLSGGISQQMQDKICLNGGVINNANKRSDCTLEVYLRRIFSRFSVRKLRLNKILYKSMTPSNSLQH